MNIVRRRNRQYGPAHELGKITVEPGSELSRQQSELGRAMNVTAPNVFQLIDILQRDGLV